MEKYNIILKIVLTCIIFADIVSGVWLGRNESAAGPCLTAPWQEDICSVGGFNLSGISSSKYNQDTKEH